MMENKASFFSSNLRGSIICLNSSLEMNFHIVFYFFFENIGNIDQLPLGRSFPKYNFVFKTAHFIR